MVLLYVALGNLKCVLHQHGHRHWSHAAGYRGIGADPVHQRRQLDIATFLRVEAGIHYDGSILDPVRLDEFRLAHGADYNIRLLDQVRQVAGAAMAEKLRAGTVVNVISHVSHVRVQYVTTITSMLK